MSVSAPTVAIVRLTGSVTMTGTEKSQLSAIGQAALVALVLHWAVGDVTPEIGARWAGSLHVVVSVAVVVLAVVLYRGRVERA